MLREIMVTQFADRALHAMLMGSTNSAGTWIRQQWFLCVTFVIFIKMLFIKRFPEPVYCFFNIRCYGNTVKYYCVVCIRNT
jgi:hypothetical protein